MDTKEYIQGLIDRDELMQVLVREYLFEKEAQ